jgi:U3 small nucleolar RNA-associated protein 21
VIHRYTRGKLLTTYSPSSSPSPLSSSSSSSSPTQQILILGNLLLALSGTKLQIYNIAKSELEGELGFPNGFEGSVMVHPSTYVNKVVIGSRDGRIGIFNIKTLSVVPLLFSFLDLTLIPNILFSSSEHQSISSPRSPNPFPP